MQAVEEVEARDVNVGDILVNMGEVVAVDLTGDYALISWNAGDANRSVWPIPARGMTYHDTATLVRFKKWSDN